MQLDDALEGETEDILVAKALIAGAGESGVIGDLVLDAEAAEPAIGEVHLNLPAECALRADREHIPEDEHPDHQLRIDRRPPVWE